MKKIKTYLHALYQCTLFYKTPLGALLGLSCTTAPPKCLFSQWKKTATKKKNRGPPHQQNMAVPFTILSKAAVSQCFDEWGVTGGRGREPSNQRRERTHTRCSVLGWMGACGVDCRRKHLEEGKKKKTCPVGQLSPWLSGEGVHVFYTSEPLFCWPVWAPAGFYISYLWNAIVNPPPLPPSHKFITISCCHIFFFLHSNQINITLCENITHVTQISLLSPFFQKTSTLHLFSFFFQLQSLYEPPGLMWNISE